MPAYELLGELGRGGMGVVYKARHRGLNRVVALKVLIGGGFAGLVEKARFRIEAEAVARLHHPNIVQVYDVGEHDGADYIALEFVDGPTMRRWQDGKPVEPRLAARLTAAVAQAVQHAHDNGIVHRDLKPGNILLRNAEAESPDSASASRLPPSAFQPKVTDFGLAKPIDGGVGLTLTGAVCGTPNYMAPEQVRPGPQAARPAVDVWGVGAVLFELLTGRPPFTGSDATEVMRAIIATDAPDVRTLVPGTPRDLAVIVAKCLERNPARRYLTAGDVAADLERFLDGRSILARPVGPLRRGVRWVGRNPTVTVLMATLAAGLAVTSTFAVALSEAAGRERAALSEEAAQRAQAVAATKAAEAARDETRAALLRTEQALADARTERDRAEENLATARRAVEHVREVIDRHQTGDPALYPVFRELLVGFEPFHERFLNQKAGDRGIRTEQAEFARKLAGLEAGFGRARQARTYYLRSAILLQDLLVEHPGDPVLRRQRGYSLAMAGAVSASLHEPDADRLWTQGLAELEQYVAARPADVAGLEDLLRARFAAGDAAADDASGPHYLAVLALVERLERLTGPTPLTARTRPHALNNVAAALTNRGLTAEAEPYWLRVLELREQVARAAADDKVARYELAKCLSNYANQLARTGRPAAEFVTRERAAGLFNALRSDTCYRVAYAEVIAQNARNLATVHASRGEPARAAECLDRAIEAHALLFDRAVNSVPVRGLHADLHTRRAEAHEAAGRHDAAAGDFRRAIDLSTKAAHREYCSARLFTSLVRCGRRAEAAEHAAALDPAKFSHAYPCIELARGWLLLAAGVEGDKAAAARENARAAVRAARRKGHFADPSDACRFLSDPVFEAVWGVLDERE